MTTDEARIQSRIRTHIKFTEHARLAMRDDNLTTLDVLEAIRNFEIIEEYPDARPFPACLLLCWEKGKKPLHVVCGLPEHANMLIIVTVYIPSKEKWPDYRRQRK